MHVMVLELQLKQGMAYQSFAVPLRGLCTHNLQLTCFVCYLKIINTFLKNNTHILKQIVQGIQKWH